MTAFLKDLKLDKYVDNFIDNGVEDLETVLELNEKHLEQMGVPLGHKLKIFKRIKETRKEMNLDQEEKVEVKQTEQQVKTSLKADPWTTTAKPDEAQSTELKEGQFDE